jgi:hypothetical protein
VRMLSDPSVQHTHSSPRRRQTLRLPLFWLTCAVLLAGSTPTDAQQPVLDTMVRWWSFHKFVDGAAGEEPVGDERVQIGGVVDDKSDFGQMVLFPQLAGPNAKAEVFSNDTGRTYWVSAQAPSASLGHGAAIGDSVELLQY